MTIRNVRRLACLIALTAQMAAADASRLIEAFDGSAETRWRFIADGVMGGVSQGQARIDDGALHLTGVVSTDNNGGFIQVRAELGGLTGEALVLRVRGNDARYTVFLRTNEGRRPWHNYKAGFTAGESWSDVRLPFAGFERSSRALAETLDPAMVISIGIAAYGADYEADLWVSEIGLE